MPRSGSKKAKRQKSPLPEGGIHFEEIVSQLILDVGKDPLACMLLSSAVDETGRIAFEKHILARHIPANFPSDKVAKVFDCFMTWVSQASSDAPLTHELHAALLLRRSVRDALRTRKRDFINRARINRKAIIKEALLNEIPIHHVNALPPDQPYPRRNTFIAENQFIYDKNDYFIQRRRQPDSRISRKHIEFLDTTQLQFDLRHDESAIFRDSLTNEVIAVVIRNACTNEEALEFVDSAVEKAIQTRVNIRKEDAGILALMGYSVGARSRRILDWVRNVIQKTIPKVSEDQLSSEPKNDPPSPATRAPLRRSSRLSAATSDPSHQSHQSSPPATASTKRDQVQVDPQVVDRDNSSAFALLWNLANTILPTELIRSFDPFLRDLGSLRMDAAGTIATNFRGHGTYTVKLPGQTFQFEGAELAPPSGVCAENYARHVHREPRQPHPFAISWSTSRRINPHLSALDNGGHFFIASHAIRIQAAPNTLTAWLPSLWHCTSLHAGEPDPSLPNQDYCSRGLAIVTSEHFPRVLRAHREGKLSRENAESALAMGPQSNGEED